MMLLQVCALLVCTSLFTVAYVTAIDPLWRP